ncbi:MAG: GTPase Era, partial [Clostridia bacterium]|nr:GTPase Era [Clostridia bacterium]
METKTAFVAIVGCPNVGKSSLLNRMLGQKVAIVSAKPQTTRTRIMGVLTKGDTQLVFTDTPGYHRPKNKLGEKMVKAVIDGIDGVDAALLVVEPEKVDDAPLRPAEEELLKRIRREGIPCVLAINKIDTLPEKEQLAVRIAELMQLYDFAAIVPTCAVKGEGVDELIDELAA